VPKKRISPIRKLGQRTTATKRRHLLVLVLYLLLPLGLAVQAGAQQGANAELEQLRASQHRTQWLALGSLILALGSLAGLALVWRRSAVDASASPWKDTAGGPSLRLEGNGGTLALEANVDGRPAIRFTDADGKERARIGLAADASPYMQLNDEQGRSRLSLGLSEGGGGGIGLFDAKGVSRVALGSGPDATANLSFLDAQGKGRLRLGMGDGDAPELLLTDDQGRIRGVLRLRDDGMVLIEMSDAQGRVRTTQGTLEDGTALVGLFGNEGSLDAGMIIDAQGHVEVNFKDK
jgi:hypothetical protein